MSFSFNKNIVFTVVLALLAVGISVWVYVFVATAVQNADASLQEIGSRIATLEEDRRRVRILEKVMEERKADFARINSFFVSRERPIGFIEEVEGLAKQTNNAIALAIEEQTAKSPELSFRITVDGSEQNVSRYLKLFELLPYALRVDDMVFQRLSGSEAGTARLILIAKIKSR